MAHSVWLPTSTTLEKCGDKAQFGSGSVYSRNEKRCSSVNVLRSDLPIGNGRENVFKKLKNKKIDTAATITHVLTNGAF